jgi:hypothetical protein
MVTRGQRNDSSTVVNFGFLDRSRYFLEIAHHEAELTPFHTHYFSEKNLVAPGIEPGPLNL